MTNPPTDQQLDAIEARVKAATPGPWERYGQYGTTFFANTAGEHLRGVGDFDFGVGEQAEADEEFVKHAREDVDVLLAKVRRLQAELAEEQLLHGDTIDDRDRASDMAANPDGQPSVTPNPDGGVILHLPETTYLDTQVWSVDVGLTGAGLEALRTLLTVREIRDDLGRKVSPLGQSEAIVQTTGYVVSCLPEGHDDRWTYSVRVSYRGDGLWSVQRPSQYVDVNGIPSPGFSWSGGPDEPATQAEMDSFDAEQAEWLKAYRFDHDEALRLAKQLAPTLTYRGRSVADVLAAARTTT